MPWKSKENRNFNFSQIEPISSKRRFRGGLEVSVWPEKRFFCLLKKKFECPKFRQLLKVSKCLEKSQKPENDDFSQNELISSSRWFRGLSMPCEVILASIWENFCQSKISPNLKIGQNRDFEGPSMEPSDDFRNQSCTLRGQTGARRT